MLVYINSLTQAWILLAWTYYSHSPQVHEAISNSEAMQMEGSSHLHQTQTMNSDFVLDAPHRMSTLLNSFWMSNSMTNLRRGRNSWGMVPHACIKSAKAREKDAYAMMLYHTCHTATVNYYRYKGEEAHTTRMLGSELTCKVSREINGWKDIEFCTMSLNC